MQKKDVPIADLQLCPQMDANALDMDEKKKNLEYNNSNQPGMLLDVAVILPCFAASRAPKQIVSDYSTFLLFSNCEISFHVTKFHSM